jgi:predicted ABC-type exoprotein transport system permease subunit
MKSDRIISLCVVILFIITCSVICSITLQSWIPFVAVIAVPMILIVLGIVRTIFYRDDRIILIDKSMISDEYKQYIDESRFEQDDDEERFIH